MSDGMMVNQNGKNKEERRRGRLSLLVTGTVALSLLSFWPAPVQAQDTESRLRRIENEIQTLSRALFRGETPPPGAFEGADTGRAADMQVRLQQLEREVRDLTGMVEQQSYEMRRFRDQLEQVLADMDSRIDGSVGSAPRITGGAMNEQPRVAPLLQNGGLQNSRRIEAAKPLRTDEAKPDTMDDGAAILRQPSSSEVDSGSTVGTLGTLPQDAQSGAGQVASSDQDGAASAVSDTPVAAYDHAYALLRDKNYDQAQGAFEVFLERYPEHDLASNARYWLGETYYVRNNFERAARIFAETYQRDPQGSKGADSLLKLGMALAGMGNKEDACLTFDQLLREYSAARGPILSRTRNERETLGCD